MAARRAADNAFPAASSKETESRSCAVSVISKRRLPMGIAPPPFASPGGPAMSFPCRTDAHDVNVRKIDLAPVHASVIAISSGAFAISPPSRIVSLLITLCEGKYVGAAAG